MADALYARQSIEKKDSISVESQLAYCRYEARGGTCIEYTDRGYSGKDTNRPGFESMMNDIRTGKIGRVIVYKLDRISRSILDFANMMEEFQKYHVEFVSSTEKFDTSTPIGRAMLHICIVFAQLERETIQKRVTDAYYERCRRGLYMGGRVPYGYRLTDTVIDGICTSMYEEVPEESEQLKQIYSMYADNTHSLGDIVRYLQEHRIRHLRGSEWNTARISELLRNPVYVAADIDVYHFFQSRGVHIHNPAEEFGQGHACYLYKGTVSDTRKQCDLSDKELVLAPHKGFIPAKIWLACRYRSQNIRQSAISGSAKNSWLSGKIKCANCGYAMIVRRAKTKWGRYFVCSHSGTQGNCRGAGCTVYADVLEDYVSDVLSKKLAELPVFSGSRQDDAAYASRFDMKRESERKDKMIRLTQIEEEVDGLLKKLPEAGSVLTEYINDRIADLDVERNLLRRHIGQADLDAQEEKKKRITGFRKAWEKLCHEGRQSAADLLIEVIRIADGRMEIRWNMEGNVYENS